MTTAAPYEGIVVLGSPRSGTTLLRRLLDAHPDIACPPETYVLSAATRFLREDPFGDDLSLGVRSGLAYSGIDEAVVVDRVRALALGFLRELAEKARKPVWAEKTAFDGFHATAIADLLDGAARFVLVVRHGLDVACSIDDLVAHTGAMPPELHRHMVCTPRPLEAWAHAWVEVCAGLDAVRKARPERCHVVRYEDLVAAPEQTLDGLNAWLGRPTDAAAQIASSRSDLPGLGDWKSYREPGIGTAGVGRWHALSPGVRRPLVSIVNPTLGVWGYPEVGPPPPVEPAAARRKLQLGLLGARMRGAAPGE